MASKQVILDGQTLHGRDRFGWWMVTELEGWDETPPEKSSPAEVANGHGQVPVPVYYGARTVTLRGRLVAKNHQLAVDAKRRLTALLQKSRTFMVASSDGVPLSGVASRGRITPGPVQGRWMTFEMELKFTDAFRYGKSHRDSTAVGVPKDLVQQGTAPAWPVLTITGNMPGGYELTMNGKLVTVTKGLGSGSTHTLDMQTGILRENGDRVYGSVDIAEYFPVEPGERQSFWASPITTGSGTVIIEFSDTYI